jgi:putative monooxygenase
VRNDLPTIQEAVVRKEAVEPLLSGASGATMLSTGTATFKPGASLPYHFHEFSEAVTVLSGRARAVVEGRIYRLNRLDCIHMPAGVVHQVDNDDPDGELVAHWAFATARPTRVLVDRVYPLTDEVEDGAAAGHPERVVRFRANDVYELSTDAYFIDLFARRFGAVGICGGHGRFLPGASLPCHIHDFDESITIVGGTATCLVQGRRYQVNSYDTVFVPKGLPHRFLNLSDAEMEMVWVYAGSEPDRRIVASGYCSGEMLWPGADLAQDEKA